MRLGRHPTGASPPNPGRESWVVRLGNIRVAGLKLPLHLARGSRPCQSARACRRLMRAGGRLFRASKEHPIPCNKILRHVWQREKLTVSKPSTTADRCCPKLPGERPVLGNTVEVSCSPPEIDCSIRIGFSRRDPGPPSPARQSPPPATGARRCPPARLMLTPG